MTAKKLFRRVYFHTILRDTLNPSTGAVQNAIEPQDIALGLSGTRFAPRFFTTRLSRAATLEANLAQEIRPKSGAAGAGMTRSGNVYTARSAKGFDADLVDEVQDFLDSIPTNRRGLGHGSCVEAQCISQAIRAGDDPAGMTFNIRLVRTSGHPDHNMPIQACKSCTELIEHYK